MKSPLTTFAALYAECMNTYWSMVTGRVPAAPAKPLTPKAAPVKPARKSKSSGDRP